ncbi:MAG: T9SS type A sorting domain-containing protein [Bacteroidales bacterium]|nr:T9SS type A sorting domain-containing protein [Bacteroidales bacterium]
MELSSKTVTFYVDTKAAVQHVAQETSLNVFPNPASDRISVECETEMRRVTLCNALGQQMLRVTPNAPQAELQVSGLPRGLYLLRVQTASGSAVRKVVVE